MTTVAANKINTSTRSVAFDSELDQAIAALQLSGSVQHQQQQQQPRVPSAKDREEGAVRRARELCRAEPEPCIGRLTI